MASWTHRENSPTELPLVLISSSEEETYALGRRLALQLGKGDIVALKGPLGSGKTLFVKGIAKGLEIPEEVTSPTYTIVSEYLGFIPREQAAEGKEPVTVYHIDAYRLKGDDDFSALGGEEIIFGKGISLIEWSELLPLSIPPYAIEVEIEINRDNTRTIRIHKAPEDGKDR